MSNIPNVSNVSSTTSTAFQGRSAKQSESKSKASTTTKVIVGTGLAALAAVGIYIASRGKIRANKATQNLANEVKISTIDDFKAAGNKFVNGKAVNAAGEAYTGTFVSKNGCKLTYENGLLKETVKRGNFSKYYDYDDLGRMKNVYIHRGPHIKNINIERNADGSIKEIFKRTVDSSNSAELLTPDISQTIKVFNDPYGRVKSYRFKDKKLVATLEQANARSDIIKTTYGSDGLSQGSKVVHSWE